MAKILKSGNIHGYSIIKALRTRFMANFGSTKIHPSLYIRYFDKINGFHSFQPETW